MTDSAFITVLSSGTFIVIFGWPLLYSFYNRSYWEKGIFPPFKLNRKANRYEAIVNTAVHILLCGRENYKEKQRFLQRFLFTEFPSYRDSMAESLSSAIAQRLTIRSTIFWLNKNTVDPAIKKKYLRLLFDMAAMDGRIISREEALLCEISQGFGLNDELLQGWMNEARIRWSEEDRKNAFSGSSSFSSLGQKQKKADVLGISPDASLEEIKKAYRKLVKIHHPDLKMKKHSSAGAERFLEIQEAYEYLAEMVKI